MQTKIISAAIIKNLFSGCYCSTYALVKLGKKNKMMVHLETEIRGIQIFVPSCCQSREYHNKTSEMLSSYVNMYSFVAV